MSSLDFLYLALAASAVSIAVFINIMLYQVILTIKMARGTLEHIHEYTKEAVVMKDKVKLQFLKGAQKIMSFFPGKHR
ncbi:MAG: hypothetical protein M3Q44_01430 [bacterium]|nr:hypothetical protein [bacterium]